MSYSTTHPNTHDGKTVALWTFVIAVAIAVAIAGLFSLLGRHGITPEQAWLNCLQHRIDTGTPASCGPVPALGP